MAGSYFFDANAGESYEDTQRKRAIAEALMSQPWTARTPGQSIAQAAERIAGALIGRGANKADKAGRARYAEQFEGATSPFPAAPAAPSGAEPTDYASSRVAQAFGDEGKPDYRSAIAKIESGGRYDAVGPTHAKMGRALGKYQIMESNIGPWSKEALGRTVTADEFLANPQLQDAIFDHKFGGYVNAYGPEGAAQAWLGGPGGVGKTGRKDSLGTSIGEYGQKFMGNLGQPSGGVQKIAQALSGGGQPPEMAGNVGGGGPSQEQLMQLASDPYASDSQKAIVNSLLEQKMRERQMLQEQQMKQSAPDYQLDLQTKQAQLAKLQQEAAGGGEFKVVGDRLVRIGQDGSVTDATPNSGQAAGQFRFGGSSVEAQALNGLMDSGQLTPDQAQQMAAGKTVSGPNGEILFLTPQGVFGQPPGGGQAVPMGQPPRQPEQPQPRQGMIPLTAPKVTVDEKEAAGFSDKMVEANSLIEKYGNAGGNVGDQFIRGNSGIPDAAENWMVSDDFQNFDQARRSFINSQLRRESGAVISPEEFANANQQYFPQPGDNESVLKQKAQNRRTAVEAMERSSGPTYKRKTSPAPATTPKGVRRTRSGVTWSSD